MSLPATAAQLCEWTGGRLLRGDPKDAFSGTKIDSREVDPGDLFVAIVGPNHDAHRFLTDVLAGGAAGALVQADRIEETLPPRRGLPRRRSRTRRRRSPISPEDTGAPSTGR